MATGAVGGRCDRRGEHEGDMDKPRPAIRDANPIPVRRVVPGRPHEGSSRSCPWGGARLNEAYSQLACVVKECGNPGETYILRSAE